MNNVASYTLGISAFTDNNYSLSVPAGITTGTLTIGKKAITVTANDATRIANTADPAFSMSYSGFIAGCFLEQIQKNVWRQ